MRWGRAVLGMVAAITSSATMAMPQETSPPVAQGPADPQRDVPLVVHGPATGPLRVVIAGMVHGHVDGFLAGAVKRKDLEIIGVAESNRSLFDAYAQKYGLDAKLYHADLEEAIVAAHPSAVLVYTNTFEHRKVVDICAKHASNGGGDPTVRLTAVMMEKPLAVSAADAHAIAEVAAKAHIAVLVNYFTTWEPNRRAAYDVVSKGEIGEVRKVVSHDGHKGPKEIGVGPEFLEWLTDPQLNGGGALYDFGCYGADFMTWLMNGERPLTVTAVTQRDKPEVYPKVEDEATIVLTYPKAQAILQASWNWPFGRSEVEVYGKTGTVITRGRDEIEVRRAGDAEAKRAAAKPLLDPQNDPISYLRAVTLDGWKPEGPGSLEINTVVAEILDAARESAKTGRTIKMGESRK